MSPRNVRAGRCRKRTAPLSACPPPGDWSFPSNHATITGAAAVTLALTSRILLWLTAPPALLMAFSRVFVGGPPSARRRRGLVVGAVVAAAAVRLGTRPAVRLAEAMRASSAPAVRWFTGPGAERVPSYDMR